MLSACVAKGGTATAHAHNATPNAARHYANSVVHDAAVPLLMLMTLRRRLPAIMPIAPFMTPPWMPPPLLHSCPPLYGRTLPPQPIERLTPLKTALVRLVARLPRSALLSHVLWEQVRTPQLPGNKPPLPLGLCPHWLRVLLPPRCLDLWAPPPLELPL
jgi:hypothetical protein